LKIDEVLNFVPHFQQYLLALVFLQIFIMLADSQIFSVLFLALIVGILAARLGTQLYK
jgi:photosystem I reaction center subunit XII